MGQAVFLPFSSLVASMLLFKEQVTDIEIVKFMDLLEQENIFIVDEVDYSMDKLFFCVDCFDYAYFKVKEGLSYDSVLSNGFNVRDHLYQCASECIVDFIVKGNYYPNFDYKVLNKKREIKRKRKINFLNCILKFGH